MRGITGHFGSRSPRAFSRRAQVVGDGRFDRRGDNVAEEGPQAETGVAIHECGVRLIAIAGPSSDDAALGAWANGVAGRGVVPR